MLVTFFFKSFFFIVCCIFKKTKQLEANVDTDSDTEENSSCDMHQSSNPYEPKVKRRVQLPTTTTSKIKSKIERNE